ncbi:MAG: hypothetical protein ABI700_10640 [Chloroflexota bacterium]
MSKIIGIQRLDETILPVTGSGDNWHMTWANDDKQYVGLCDGRGWSHLPEYTGQMYNTRMFSINGDAPAHSFEFMPGYPDLELLGHVTSDQIYSQYYGFGILALDDTRYHFLSTPRDRFGTVDNAFIGAKLIYSPDGGSTWKNQDGAPLRWEDWGERNHETMLFFNEPDACFSLLTVLQMGKNYADNRDGYVYIYAPNGSSPATMNQLVMLRVRKKNILQRSSYEYFAALNPDGSATWTTDINQRGVVCAFPDGWVNWRIGGKGFGVHPYGWHPSVVYNRALDTYMMFNWGIGLNDLGDWFGKPSYLGFWTAPQPWGPWTHVHEDLAWTPGGDPTARCYQPQISPKWISDDGISFWMVWADFRAGGGDYPYYAFNCQKVNLITAD